MSTYLSGRELVVTRRTRYTKRSAPAGLCETNIDEGRARVVPQGRKTPERVGQLLRLEQLHLPLDGQAEAGQEHRTRVAVQRRKCV